MIGTSSIIETLIRMVRTKILATLLGPSGVGLLALFSSISDMVGGLVGSGVNNSGVRQIAESVGSGRADQIARTVYTFRRLALLCALIGAGLLLGFARPLARFSFGDETRAFEVMLLAPAVLFGVLSTAQIAVILAMRRLGDVARISILSSLLGTLVSVPLIYRFGEAGIVYSILATSVAALAVSLYFGRKVSLQRIVVGPRECLREAISILKLAVVFIITDPMTIVAGYMVRIIIVNGIDTEAAGYFQAAFSLGGLYIGYILASMTADLYPRLAAVAREPDQLNRLVNEQILIGLLLAGPGVFATMATSATIVSIFYSEEFQPAAEILRWISAGMLIRVISWPMGFVFRAQARRGIILVGEVLKNGIQLLTLWILVTHLGTFGIGIAFLISDWSMSALTFLVLKRTTGFRFTRQNASIAAAYLAGIVVVMASWETLPPLAATVCSIAVAAISGLHSVRILERLQQLGWLPRPIRYCLSALHIVR